MQKCNGYKVVEETKRWKESLEGALAGRAAARVVARVGTVWHGSAGPL